ncbi:cellulase [Sorangium cellulosum]|uniref:cellulase n=1 Tax=Sorangium cellulosum TaxID=56 RepID=A0A2L0F1B1_SORCE|nr:glycosyl hydrolase family 8 [Sorangium cellulosum]AUX45326.1 cellulase [Sorangium cellulosum]
MDSLGYDSPGYDELQPIAGPQQYPNELQDVLHKTDDEIAAKIQERFQQLFYGDPVNEAIYYEKGEDQARIVDTFHGDVRSEGIGLGMIIAVQLDKREEHDRLWRYAQASLERTSGPGRGYFESSCDTPVGPLPCFDPFGQQQLAMALIFAHNRWGSDTGDIDYEADALELLEVMRYKEAQNGGVVEGVTNVFDAETKLAFDFPHTAAAGITRPSIEMPAYYELWAQATGDTFWSEAAASARAHWQRAAHPVTGLMPERATFEGEPVFGSHTFDAEAYRTSLNMALDHIWFGVDPWQVEEANRLLSFFSAKGIDTYGPSYLLEGGNLEFGRDRALIVMNGVTGLMATNADRAQYIEAAWAETLEVGQPRYYSGILNLLSLLVLSGQFRVY